MTGEWLASRLSRAVMVVAAMLLSSCGGDSFDAADADDPGPPAAPLSGLDVRPVNLTCLAAGTAGPPAQLSASGCVNPASPVQAASGLIPYSPNASFWSDGATKERFLALPEGRSIEVDPAGDFDFPIGSVLMKHFRLGAQLVETRLLMHHDDGSWAGYTYEWNALGTDATRVTGGKTVQVAGQAWHFPSESQCLFCHSEAAGRSLGLETAQLNGMHGYTSTGRTANQLATLGAIGVLAPTLALPPAQLPVLPVPFGTAPLDQRARAYLHTNCSHCHRPGGPTPANMDLRYDTPLAQTGTCDVIPLRGDLGIAGARIIDINGSAREQRSLLVIRPSRTDAAAMPPVLPRIVDAAGVALLTEWINSLTGCG
jgi:uncharacterized repeat protein (TIGR03806 family)